MNRPTISIIVPVYNVEKYLQQCIDSIIAQSFVDWECLLIDDGSPDNSGAICDEYAKNDGRFRVFHKENAGVSAARNLGIKEAEGEWITYIDADDFVSETFLQGLLQPLLGQNQLDFVHGGCTNYENGHVTTINQNYSDYVGKDKGRLFSSFRGLIVAKLFKTDILHKSMLLFDEGMKIAEDMAFTIDYLSYVETYAFVSESGYFYRRDNDNSATHREKWLSYQQTRKVFEHLYHATINFIKDNHISYKDSRLRYEQRANQYFMVIRSMYHETSLTRRMRINILRSDSKAGLFNLLQYIKPGDNYYKFTRILLDNRLSIFDTVLYLKESLVKIKDGVKTTVNVNINGFR